MSSFRIVSSQDLCNTIPVMYFGYQPIEVENFQKNYQSIFIGQSDDLILELITDAGEIYHAILKAGTSMIGKFAILPFRKTDRLLIFVKGALYRISINDKKCYSNNVFFPDRCDDFVQRYSHAMASDKHQMLILVDDEGVRSLTWENVLWECPLEWTESCYLKLLGIDGDQIQLDYYAPDDGGEESVKIDINKGILTTKPKIARMRMSKDYSKAELMINFTSSVWDTHFPSYSRAPLTLSYDPLSLIPELLSGLSHIAHGYEDSSENPDDRILVMDKNYPIENLPAFECIIITSMDTEKRMNLILENLIPNGIAIVVDNCIDLSPWKLLHIKPRGEFENIDAIRAYVKQ
jgi:hypothetical protein